jgi:hypothetical protein
MRRELWVVAGVESGANVASRSQMGVALSEHDHGRVMPPKHSDGQQQC